MDGWGHTYIYRCLDWSYPMRGGMYNAQGKLLILNFFFLIPLFNFLYWLVVWARRRTLTLCKKAAEPPATTPRPSIARRVLFEYGADYRDLALDGRHWRAQFGGASSPRAPKMGAYICCDANLYPLFRLVLAALSVTMLMLRVLSDAMPGHWFAPFLYFENWVLVIAAIYFSFACVLTAVAVYTEGRKSSSAPLLVWLTWGAYGALLPASMLNALVWAFVTTRDPMTVMRSSVSVEVYQAFDLICIFGTLTFTFLDAWINRQPYYATYCAAQSHHQHTRLHCPSP